TPPWPGRHLALGARLGAAACSGIRGHASPRDVRFERSGKRLCDVGRFSLVAEARHYLGGNPTGRGSLWCARFMNMVLEKTGHHGTGSGIVKPFAPYCPPLL